MKDECDPRLDTSLPLTEVRGPETHGQSPQNEEALFKAYSSSESAAVESEDGPSDDSGMRDSTDSPLPRMPLAQVSRE